MGVVRSLTRRRGPMSGGVVEREPADLWLDKIGDRRVLGDSS